MLTNPVSFVRSKLLTLQLGYYCFLYSVKALMLAKKNPSRSAQDKIIKDFAKYTLKPLRINFKLHGFQALANLPANKPIVFMSNHSSLYDIPIMMHTIPENISFRMLAKKELYDIPLFGRAMARLDFPKIDRSNHQQALKDLEHTKALMRSGIALWAAPEGRRSEDGELLPFKKGVFIMAIELGALIVPISIKNAHKVLPANTYKYSLNQTVSLTVGESVDTSNFTLADRDFIMNKIRSEIIKGISD